jgi:hypothetical protein
VVDPCAMGAALIAVVSTVLRSKTAMSITVRTRGFMRLLSFWVLGILAAVGDQLLERRWVFAGCQSQVTPRAVQPM